MREMPLISVVKALCKPLSSVQNTLYMGNGKQRGPKKPSFFDRSLLWKNGPASGSYVALPGSQGFLRHATNFTRPSGKKEHFKLTRILDPVKGKPQPPFQVSRSPLFCGACVLPYPDGQVPGALEGARATPTPETRNPSSARDAVGLGGGPEQ